MSREQKRMKNISKKAVAKLRGAVGATVFVAPMVVGGITSYAAEGDVSTVTTALTTGISSIANDAMSAIGSVIPLALPIMGAIVVVGIGIKVFRKVTGK